jgi:hypothetical protein
MYVLEEVSGRRVELRPGAGQLPPSLYWEAKP